MLTMPSVEVTGWGSPKTYGIYMNGRPTDELIAELVRHLPLKISLSCGNFRWFSMLHIDMLSDIPCNCGAPYEHYFIKWKR